MLALSNASVILLLNSRPIFRIFFRSKCTSWTILGVDGGVDREEVWEDLSALASVPLVMILDLASFLDEDDVPEAFFGISSLLLLFSLLLLPFP